MTQFYYVKKNLFRNFQQKYIALVESDSLIIQAMNVKLN